jgi:hypothetical protein
MKTKSLEKIKWIARITATIIILFAFPFYIGYGLPFPNSSLSLIENIHLIVMPIILIGLIVGWKWKKIAGYMICLPIFVKLLFALIFLENPGSIIILLAIPGSLYLIYGYKKFSAGNRNS